MKRLRFEANSRIVFFCALLEGGEAVSRASRILGGDALVLVEFGPGAKPKAYNQVLEAGVDVLGTPYSFLGSTNKQLDTRKCYFVKGDNDEASKAFHRLGSFDHCTTASQCSKRLQLLFTPVMIPFEVAAEQSGELGDVVDHGFNFTDGCGHLQRRVARRVKEELRLPWLPSVFQIRLAGYKGVLVVDHRLGKSSKDPSVQLRPSMLKFESSDRSLGIVGYSRPFSYGYMNEQLVLLLLALGVPLVTVQAKLEEAIDRLRAILALGSEAEVLPDQETLRIAVDVLQELRPGLALDLAASKCITPRLQRVLVDHAKEIVNRMKKKMSCKGKLSFPVHRSRLVYGVADPTATLEYGHCFFQPTLPDGPRVLTGPVFMARSPCYHAGDVRVLQAVNSEDVVLGTLTDCVVFPVKGPRPHADESSGGDLDGDLFFVCWDQDLLPTQVPAHLIPSPVKPEGRLAGPTRQGLMELLVGYIRPPLGLADMWYRQWAALNGVQSSECVQLGDEFCRLVDLALTGGSPRLSEHLRPKPEMAREPPEVLVILRRTLVRALRSTPAGPAEGAAVPIPSDVVEQHLEHIHDLSGPTLQRLAHWCCFQEDAINAAVRDADCLALTDMDLLEARCLPLQHSLLTNAMARSRILSPAQLEEFRLDYLHPRWSLIPEAPKMPMCSQIGQCIGKHHRVAFVLEIDGILPHGHPGAASTSGRGTIIFVLHVAHQAADATPSTAAAAAASQTDAHASGDAGGETFPVRRMYAFVFGEEPTFVGCFASVGQKAEYALQLKKSPSSGGQGKKKMMARLDIFQGSTKNTFLSIKDLPGQRSVASLDVTNPARFKLPKALRGVVRIQKEAIVRAEIYAITERRPWAPMAV